jgi:hypothetical protein
MNTLYGYACIRIIFQNFEKYAVASVSIRRILKYVDLDVYNPYRIVVSPCHFPPPNNGPYVNRTKWLQVKYAVNKIQLTLPWINEVYVKWRHNCLHKERQMHVCTSYGIYALSVACHKISADDFPQAFSHWSYRHSHRLALLLGSQNPCAVVI